MAVSLTVLKETGDETRVSATPETVKKNDRPRHKGYR